MIQADSQSVPFCHGPQLSDTESAVLVFMSRDMKTKQRQNKYFTSPRKLTYKPLPHTTVCKVPSTHQAQTKPWSHTPLEQKPHRIHPGTAASNGSFLRARLTPVQETSICSPTFIPVSIPKATGTCFSVGFYRWASRKVTRQYRNSLSIFLHLFSNKCQLMPFIAGCFYSPSLTT